MNSFSKLLLATLLSGAVFSSCSRPVAYFQSTARQQVTSTKTLSVMATPMEATPSTLLEEASPTVAVSSPQPVAGVPSLAQANQAIRQIETYVRNDSKLASNKKVVQRMARVSKLLASPTAQAAMSTKTAPAQKTTLFQRLMLKKLDKKIKDQLAPERTMAKSLLTIGLIVGVIGLILLLLNVASPLGLIALIVGLALVLVDLLR
ncbi:hypothetical protein [Spirosoma areae]